VAKTLSVRLRGEWEGEKWLNGKKTEWACICHLTVKTFYHLYTFASGFKIMQGCKTKVGGEENEEGEEIAEVVQTLRAHLHRVGGKDGIQQSHRLLSNQRQKVEASFFKAVSFQNFRYFDMALQKAGEKPQNSNFGGRNQVLVWAGSFGILTGWERKGGNGGKGDRHLNVSISLNQDAKGG